MRLFEIVSTEIYPYKIKTLVDTKVYSFNADEINIEVQFDKHYDIDDDNVWAIEFFPVITTQQYTEKLRKKPAKIFKLLGTIEAIANNFLNAHKPDRLIWFANKKKRDIYRRFKHPNYKFYQNHFKKIGGDPEEGLVRK